MKQHFEMMAAYNHWANRTLYAAAAELSPDEFSRDVGVFFRSMTGTLNHILVADRIWMRRFTGEGDAPDRLDAILYSAFPALRLARDAEDKRIAEWVDTLAEDAFHGRFTYMSITNPTVVSQRLAPALTHFFNHQAHHRGHAHAILSLLGKNPPSLDLSFFHRTADGHTFA